jgi:hypothetical protein
MVPADERRLPVDVVKRRRTKLGLVVAGLVAAGAASLPTLLGPDASAAQQPGFTSNPTSTPTAKPTSTPTSKPGLGKCIPEYTDNNWCPPV